MSSRGARFNFQQGWGAGEEGSNLTIHKSTWQESQLSKFSSDLYISAVPHVSPEGTHIPRVDKFISNSLTETLKLSEFIW